MHQTLCRKSVLRLYLQQLQPTKEAIEMRVLQHDTAPKHLEGFKKTISPFKAPVLYREQGYVGREKFAVYTNHHASKLNKKAIRFLADGC